MIRSLCIVIFVALYLIFTIPVLGLEWLLGKFSPRASDISSLRIVQWALRVIIRLAGVQVTVIGEENIPDEPVLYIGNHRSYFDIVLTYSRCRRLTGFIAKKEMERLFTLSTWMERLHCLFLDRKNPKEGLKTILQAVDNVKHGISVFIFPEGTRNRGAELSMLPFRDGALKISTKTGCAIIPVSLNNTAEIFENHTPFIKKTHVVIEYGSPIYPDQLDKDIKKHIGEYVEKIIQETIRKNADLV